MLIALSARALLEVLSLSNNNSLLLLLGLPYPSTVMSYGSIVYFFLCGGDPKFLERLIRDCEAMSWEVFSLPSIIVVLQ